MKVVADMDIPFLEGVFEPYGEVVYKKGLEISHEDVLDADALVVRTRTRCDAALLEGTSVKMVATATIGRDHIDLGYCRNAGIVGVGHVGSKIEAMAEYLGFNI